MSLQEPQLPTDSRRYAVSYIELASDAVVAGADAGEEGSTVVSSPTKDAWRRFRHNWAALISLAIIMIAVMMAIFAPYMHTTDPTNLYVAPEFSGPGWSHWFGGDALGRDLYSRLIYGLRAPLFVGLIGTALTVLLGTLIGVTAGYFGGWVDGLLSRFTDLMFAFPSFVLALIVVSLYGPAFDSIVGGGVGRTLLLIVVFSVVSWPPLMRFVRSLALSMKEQQFIEAARTSGTTNWGIIRRHLLPNMWGLILVQGAFIVIAVISTETILSIFGLGVQPPNPDLGQMLSDGASTIDYSYWPVLSPAIALALVILSFTFLADGLRDAVDPRGKD